MGLGYADTRYGQMHYLDEGEGPPLVLLHQTPISHLVYSRLAPLLSTTYRVIGLDNPGFGNSDRLPPGSSVADISSIIPDVLDHLQITRAALFGLHTGATIAAEVACASPGRVSAVLLAGFPYLLADERPEFMRAAELPMGTPGALPVVVPEDDGSHLMKLWMRGYQRTCWGQDTLPPELLSEEELAFVDAYVMQAVVAWESISETFKAVFSYASEERIPLIQAPTLLLEAAGPYERAFCKRADAVQEMIPGSEITRLAGADSYCAYWRPDEVAQAMTDFLERQPSWS